MPNPSPQGHHRFTFGSGARPLDGYTIKRAVGRGGFGEVYYATSDSGKEVALKLILHNLEVERRGVVQCMNLKCPNLLAIHDLKTNDAGDSFVVMEYVAGPSLASVLARHPRGLPTAEVRAWLKGLVEGVAYLHDHGIVHRDLKPANLFMEEGLVKIGDYGLAKLIDASRGSDHSESIGTCHYMAPEIASGKYHKPIDIYAIGVILYEMITGRVPFEGETVGEILMKHLTARPDLSPLPEPYRTIVGRALAKDPAQRPARAYDLLPPEDAPKVQPVRFIGDGKVTPPLPPDLEILDDEKEKDEVLRFGPDDPVFYIGPETRPPRPPAEPRPRRGWGVARRPPRPAAPPRTPATAPRPGPAPRPRRTTPPAPLEPPPMPSGRVRLAELAGSMIWAALFVIVLSAFAAAALGVDVPAEPQRFAYLVGLGLLGTWGILITNKVLEGRTVDRTTRGLLNVALGVLVALAGLALGHWTHVRVSPHTSDFQVSIGLRGFEALQSIAYFGIVFLVNGGWAGLAARDRKARFRVWPIATTGLIAAVLYPLWPYTEAYGPATAILIAVCTQLASPWNEYAAAYARAKNASDRAAA
jgi:hypothetical protein